MSQEELKESIEKLKSVRETAEKECSEELNAILQKYNCRLAIDMRKVDSNGEMWSSGIVTKALF